MAPYNFFIVDHHHILVSSVIALLLWYLCFLLVYPLAATPLFPHVSFLGARFCLVLWSICHEIEQLHLPIYNSPKGAVRVVHHRDFPLVDAVMDSSGVHANFSHHRVSPDLSAVASPSLVVDPSDTASRK